MDSCIYVNVAWGTRVMLWWKLSALSHAQCRAQTTESVAWLWRAKTAGKLTSETTKRCSGSQARIVSFEPINFHLDKEAPCTVLSWERWSSSWESASNNLDSFIILAPTKPYQPGMAWSGLPCSPHLILKSYKSIAPACVLVESRKAEQRKNMS